MTFVSTPASQSLVSIQNGKAATTSNVVAATFGKQHDDVLRRIRNLIAQLDVDRLRNFAETVVERANPSGGDTIKSPAYLLTRDGFTLLAMGFTGKKALQFKLAYIDAFNTMEAELLRISTESKSTVLSNKTLTPAQQRSLQEVVGRKAAALPRDLQSMGYVKLWSGIKSRFHVGTYKDLAPHEFDAAVSFVESYTWDLLDAPKAPQVQAKRYQYPKEMLMQPYFCGTKEDGTMSLPKLDLRTFGDSKFESPLARLLKELHDDGHNVDAPFAELAAIQEGLKILNEQLDAIANLGVCAGNSVLKMLNREL